MNIYTKIILFLLMSFVTVAGAIFPIAEAPNHWYEFPLIVGLDQRIRIIFVHVSTAWLSVVAFFMAMFYGVKYLRKGNYNYDAKSYSALLLGFLFSVLATITGAIWAKFNWGEFWSWDPRQTSIFILLLIYGALFVLRSAVENTHRKAKLSAVYSILAFLTVPFFVFIMPRVMLGLHPGSAESNSQGPVVDFNMNLNMQIIFSLSLIAFTILFVWIWKISYRYFIIKEKIYYKIESR